MAETLSSIGSMVGADIRELRLNKIDSNTADSKYIRSDLNTGTQILSTDFEISGDFSATTITETSSIQYKEDVKDLENAKEIIKKLRPVTYRWKESQKMDYGFIAEEAQEVIPELIKVQDGVVQGMNYSKITSILTSVVQEQQKEIDELKSAVNTLIYQINSDCIEED